MRKILLTALVTLLTTTACNAQDSEQVTALKKRCEALSKETGKDYLYIYGKINKHFISASGVSECWPTDISKEKPRKTDPNKKGGCLNPSAYHWLQIETSNPPFVTEDGAIPIIVGTFKNDAKKLEPKLDKANNLSICGFVKYPPTQGGGRFAIPVLIGKLDTLELK